MTIVGEAELDIRAIGASFAGDLQRVVRPGMYQAGTVMEQTAARGRHAFGMMWTSFADASQGALGPVTAMVSQVQNVAEDLHSSSRLLQGAAVGAAGVGIGVGLQMFGSKEQQAHQQLQATIETTGGYWEAYAKEIDGAIAAGHRMAVHNYDTMDALNRLTIATHNPERAIQDYSVVLKIAAARHMSVTSAAAMLASVYGGNTRMFRMFGMNVAAGNKALAEQERTTKAHTKAVGDLKTARQNLADTEARINASRQGHAATAAQVAAAEAAVASARASVATTDFQHGTASPQAAAASARLTAAEARLTDVQGKGATAAKLTVSQQIELRKAHEKVAEAAKNVTKTTTDMTKAHKAAAGATSDVQTHIDDLSKRLSGQYSAAVNNFGTEVKSFGIDLEDALGTFGAKYGSTVTGLSTGVLAVSALSQGAIGIFSRFSTGGRAAIAMNQVFAETTAAEVAATNASTEASVASLQAQALLADSEIAAAASTAAEESAGAWAAAGGEIDASIGASAATAEGEFAAMGVASGEAAMASRMSWAGALGKMGIGLAAFAVSYEGTMALLKHTPLGKGVQDAADWIGHELGFGNYHVDKLGSQTEKVVAFAMSRHETLDQLLHDKKGLNILRHTFAVSPPGYPPGWHPPMLPPGSPKPPPPGWHPPMLLPGQHRPGQQQGVFGELRGLRTDVLRLVRAAEKQVAAMEKLPHGLRADPSATSPSLATLW